MGKKKVIEKTAGVESAKPSEAPSQAKSSKKISQGRIYINASYNNTMITVTDAKGGVVAWASAGSLGFSGPKKATPFASSKVIAAIMEKVDKTGPNEVDLYISGVGAGRDSAIRTLANYPLTIHSLHDITPIPHNGPRPPKARRV